MKIKQIGAEDLRHQLTDVLYATQEGRWDDKTREVSPVAHLITRYKQPLGVLVPFSAIKAARGEYEDGVCPDLTIQLIGLVDE